MKEHNISCKDVMHHICDSLGEDLNSPKCKAIKEHLSECDGCQQYFHSINDTIKLYKDYNAELPDDSQKKLMDCLGLSDVELNFPDKSE